jgi:hypothetical protein
VSWFTSSEWVAAKEIRTTVETTIGTGRTHTTGRQRRDGRLPSGKTRKIALTIVRAQTAPSE